MNYAAHYDRLMERARHRSLIGYRERHHVVPRCMGGGNEKANLVELTPEEHYVAHQLLVKMHPGNKSLVHAVLYMAKQCSGNKAFGWLRRRKADAMRGNKMNVGRKQSPEAIAKTAAANRGNKHTLGHTLTPEHRAKISASGLGKKKSKPWTDERRANIAAANSRRVWTAEARANMSAAHLGKKRPPGTGARISAATLGMKNTPEHRAKQSASMRGKVPWNKGRRLTSTFGDGHV